MNVTEYRQLKREAQETCQKAVALAEKERDESVAAIERVWGLSRKRPRTRSQQTPPTAAKSQLEFLPPEQTSPVPLAKAIERGALADCIRKAVAIVPERFTRLDVMAAMRTISPQVADNCRQTSVCVLLKRMVKKGIVKETQQGTGNSLSRYQRVYKIE